MSDLVFMAKIVAAHGINGQVKIKSFSKNLSQYNNFFDSNGNILVLKSIKNKSDDVVIATIENIISRNQAEQLKGTELFIHKNNLPKLNENEFYYEELIGRQVITDKEKIGIISGVFNFGAGDFFEVTLNSGKKANLHISGCEITENAVICEKEQLV